MDTVLGEGTRERGAEVHLIDPALPGFAYVWLETSPSPVRAAFVSDRELTAMAEVYGAEPYSEGEVG
ncbi:hypothetical protein ACWFMI_09175 [Nocardiopsis terrae]